jgi:glycosyltransferase involved in cell wall biosynthesis
LSATAVRDALLLVVAGGIAFVWTSLALRLWRGSHLFPRLPDVPAEAPPGGWPAVSVIVPSRNEEMAVAAATRALLAQDYPALEVVAVDDRSTDATGRLLDALAAGDARLTVRHVTVLPAGWLGKNNAMAVGASGARGEWLLFTDADIFFAPDVVKRAVAFASRHQLGHVVALPHLIAPGFLERAFVACFGLFANLVFQVWDLKRPGSRAFVGVGAFNLVRRDAYAAVGGHSALAFEVVDDAKLGLILRRSGVPQGALDSGGLVRVRWQQGFVASLHGLIKNAFAALEWSFPRAVAFAVALCAFTTAPLLIALLADGAATRGLAAWGALVPVLMVGAVARRAIGGSGAEGLALPLCGPLLSAVTLVSAALALWRRGIVWRGTFYALADLRRGCVREGDWPTDRAVGWPRP